MATNYLSRYAAPVSEFTTPADQRRESASWRAWPTDSEIRQAQRYGIGYGSSMDNYLAGEVAWMYGGPALEGMVGRSVGDVQNELLRPSAARHERRWVLGPSSDDMDRAGLMYTGAQIAANRSALVGLGLDPSRFAINTRDKGLNLAGMYGNEYVAGDRGYAGSSFDREYNATGQTLSHEAVHRSMEMLRRDERTKDLVSKIMGRSRSDEEQAVRQAMWLLAGSPVHNPAGFVGDERAQAHALDTHQRRDLAHYGLRRTTGGNFPIEAADDRRLAALTAPERVMALELIAAELVAMRRPRGPR